MKTSSLEAKRRSLVIPSQLEVLVRPNPSAKLLNNPLSRPKVLDRLLMAATLVLGLLHAWLGRFSMNPDGISYLDVGDAFVHHNWAVAVNAWWSPLYPWTLGLVLSIIRPSPKWEFPIVHLVNFAIFVVALLGFRFLLQAALAFVHGKATNSKLVNLPDWAVTLTGYAIFLWVSLEILTIYSVAPDLAVSACICFSTGAFLRLRDRVSLSRSISLGLILGIGYWTKTILLPIGVVSLILAYFWASSRGWRKGIICATATFAAVSAPLICMLSLQKGRFTFGDSGRVNYAWALSGANTRNWHGEIGGSGTPKHPTRLLSQHPPIFEFDGPIAGTYPPWTDPSYWNDGIQTTFSLRRQLEVLASTCPSEARLLFRSQPALLAGIFALAMLSGPLWIFSLREIWPLISIQVIGMAAYAPIIENDRYLGGFVLVLFFLLFGVMRLSPKDRRAGICICVGIFVAMSLGTLDHTVRTITHHFAIPGNGPNSTAESEAVAEQLHLAGTRPGEKVAIIGDGTDAYWARLGRFGIVAEIMAMNHGAQQFWDSPTESKQEVYKRLSITNARIVVSSCPLDIPADWHRLRGTSFCFRSLE
ncbi:MAG: hypothetical protein JWQ87_3285 [Candidatus Sulfotelmatobacter sp.]|nr:hypothetical protein [Candidatus Sulfotelmatobacter sp.]